jgi:hypothetical protein
MTCGPHLSASSFSSHLLISLPPLLHYPRTPNLRAGELDPGGATGKPAAPDSPQESSTPVAELVFLRPQPPCRGAQPQGLYRQARRPNLCAEELCTSQSQGQDCSYDGHGRLQFRGWKICSLVQFHVLPLLSVYCIWKICSLVQACCRGRPRSADAEAPLVPVRSSGPLVEGTRVLAGHARSSALDHVSEGDAKQCTC